jgi:hypothetical protein
MPDNEQSSISCKDFIYIMSSTPNNWWQTGFYLFQEAEDIYKLNERRRKIVYKRIQNTPNFDYYTASALENFATKFSFQIPRFYIYYLLVGYSLENWLKGFYILKNTKTLSSQLSKIISTHDLINLSGSVHFKIDKKEREVLKRIIVYVKSYAKYPIDMNSTKHSENIKLIWSPTVIEAIINCKENPYQNDKKIIDNLCTRLTQHINDYCEKNPVCNKDYFEDNIQLIFEETM